MFNNGRETYLHTASDLAQPVDAITRLIDLGANENLQGVCGASPTWVAIPYGRCISSYLEVWDDLVKGGGDVTVRHSASFTPNGSATRTRRLPAA